MSKRPTMDPVVRKSVYTRSAGWCDLCCLRLNEDAWECHHRRLRSQGGQDEITNLIALHPGCHQHVHRTATEWAYAHGFLCPVYRLPTEWPVFRHRAYWQDPGAEWRAAKPHEEQLARASVHVELRTEALDVWSTDVWGEAL